jgi:hypothetical protein
MGYVIQNGDKPNTRSATRGSATGAYTVAKRLRLLRVTNVIITSPKGQRLTYAELEAFAARERAVAKGRKHNPDLKGATPRQISRARGAASRADSCARIRT